MADRLETQRDAIHNWLGLGTIIFMSKPFAGKDSQTRRLANPWGVPVIGSGDIIRASEVNSDDQQGTKSGRFIPTELFKTLVFPQITETSSRHPEKPLFLNGVGRALGEESEVLNLMQRLGRPTKAVIYLSVTDGEVYRRLETTPRGREDDRPDVVTTRLEEFQNQTELVLKTYENRGLLIPVDAMGEKQCVAENIIIALHAHALASNKTY
jgi:adenylate kinase family enzyme